jgi:predicted unusual protein kinase regulating ubiquinone biosynthesis (AarF/ABC1/UbiB family)
MAVGVSAGAAALVGLAVLARSARRGAQRRRHLLDEANRRAALAAGSSAAMGATPAPVAVDVTGPSAPAGDGEGVAAVVGRRTARNLALARMSYRIGRNTAATNARQIFASAGRREQLRSQQQMRTAAEVVQTLGSMKGALMKLGQMASYLDPALPPEVRHALASLQASAPPMSPQLAAGVIERELGQPPESLFDEWDPVPIAAASIGQVHRAISREGAAVAVKVQYPGVDDAIRADLDNSEVLAGLLQHMFPGLDTAPLIGELRERIGEELDYQVEASNQHAFSRRLSGHPFLHVPSVHFELSTGRVLTSELVAGVRYEDVTSSWDQQQRDMAGEAIFRFVFGSLYQMRAFNGDPHPGNYLFHGDGRVTFLDFGLVKWYSPDEVRPLEVMIEKMVLEEDMAGFRRAAEVAGFLPPGAALTDDQVADYFAHYYQLVLQRGPVTCSSDYASRTVRQMFDASNPVVKHANMPAEFAVLQRINLGLYAVLAGLGATADWRAIAEEIWPFVAAPPSTELGRLEAEWAASSPADPPPERQEPAGKASGRPVTGG